MKVIKLLVNYKIETNWETELFESNDNHIFEINNLKLIITELQEKLEYDTRRMNREFSEKLDNVYECIEKLELGREKKAGNARQSWTIYFISARSKDRFIVTYPQMDLKTVVSWFLWKFLSTLRIPSTMRDPKFDQKWYDIFRVLRPVWDFKNIVDYLAKSVCWVTLKKALLWKIRVKFCLDCCASVYKIGCLQIPLNKS